MRNKNREQFANIILPVFMLGSLTGVTTAIVISLYKLCAGYIIHFSEKGYAFFGEHLYLIVPILGVLLLIAYVFDICYKKHPTLKGGGIPTSIGILRGIIHFNWLKNLLGTFFLSLTSFLIGVPLGNEGPSVQMGTAIGRGNILSFAKKHRAWDRYSMTGGACAGFSVATGAPISGIIFAIEEAHQRISPMIIMVSSVSVLFAHITTEFISALFNINTSLFPDMNLKVLSIKYIWIPIVIGICVGVFAVFFLKYYKMLSEFFTEKLKKIPAIYKIFAIFALTLVFGLCSHSFISTGHELILSLFEDNIAIFMLLVILLVRTTLTLGANANGITGGMFVPLLAIGAVLSCFLAKIMVNCGLSQEYFSCILMLGIAACVAGIMKMPLTAIIFSVEALSCYNNIFNVIIATAIAFAVTEIFDAKSINDIVLENNIERLNKDKEIKVVDTFVTVKPSSFAVSKQIRDIFWPANLFVLSVKHTEVNDETVDEHGGNAIREGDILHIRYATQDESITREELTAIVGKQD